MMMMMMMMMMMIMMMMIDSRQQLPELLCPAHYGALSDDARLTSG